MAESVALMSSTAGEYDLTILLVHIEVAVCYSCWVIAAEAVGCGYDSAGCRYEETVIVPSDDLVMALDI